MVTDAPSSRPTSALAALVRPTLESWAERLERLLGGRASVQRRLGRAGSSMSVEAFRFSQVVWGLTGFGVALAIGVLGPAREPGRAIPWLVVSAGAGVMAVLARDSALTRQVRLREDLILAEFPVVADLMALAVAAGEGPAAAIDRVVGSCRGALPDELGVVLAQSRTGIPLTASLDEMAQRSGLAIVSRFAEGLAVAIERGTPLVDVLAAQAADVREAAKRALIETGARKELAMMVPVVFLIMPVTPALRVLPRSRRTEPPRTMRRGGGHARRTDEDHEHDDKVATLVCRPAATPRRTRRHPGLGHDHGDDNRDRLGDLGGVPGASYVVPEQHAQRLHVTVAPVEDSTVAPKDRRRVRSEDGSAIADFALVSVVLVPLFFGILQLALIWHVGRP